jgi:hypothetical protein
MTPGTISAWLGIITTIAVGAARITTLENAKDTQVQWTAELSAVTKRHEERLQQLERSSEMLERVHQLEMRLKVLEVETTQQEAKSRHAR